MKQIIIGVLIICLLTACYDQRLLKEHTLILSIGYDRESAKEMKQTIIFPVETENGGAEGGLSSKYNKISVKGETTKDTDIKMDRFSPENFDRSKAKVILFGEELAKEGVFTTLDSIYRDLRGPLHAVIAVVDETAEDALSIDKKYNMLISDFYLNLLHSASDVGLTTAENVQDICPVILTAGEDVTVPYIQIKDEGKVAEVDGLALFTDDRMTGKISGQDAIVYVVLANKAPKHTKLNVKIADDEEEIEENYVDFSIRNMKRKMKIDASADDIQVQLDYTLQVHIDEFARHRLVEKSVGEQVEKEVAAYLTKKSEEIIKTMQEVNHDGFGIGQQVKAFHHNVWKDIEWKEVYPDITITPHFEIEVTTHGIIN